MSTTTSKKSAAPAVPAQNKKQSVLALLRRQTGASLADITTATGWLPHSARAVLTGLRKKGYDIGKSRLDGVTRYAISAEPHA